MQEHIYIEAHREAHVKIALKGSNILYENRIKLIPNEEMTDVFNMDKVKPLNIGPGSLVRIKIGDYKGDLA